MITMNQEINIIDFETTFLALQKELKTFLFRLTCNRQDAEDIVQDTFVSAVKAFKDFKNQSSLKTWIFAIAINKAKNLQKVQKRWQIDYQDKGEAYHLANPAEMEKLYATFHNQPDAEFEIREHIDFCFNCITKTLDLPQQICIWLKEFYGFTILEIQQATGLSEGTVKHSLTYGKKHLNEVFEQRCAFINKQGVCHQCTSLKGFFNPNQDALAKTNEIKIQKQGNTNPDLLALRMEMIKDINPLQSNTSHVHNYMLENTPEWVASKNEK
jgi:RNA polymerase sigma-70 factor (ECF subfamily)